MYQRFAGSFADGRDRLDEGEVADIMALYKGEQPEES
jgi:hypothetical protein